MFDFKKKVAAAALVGVMSIAGAANAAAVGEFWDVDPWNGDDGASDGSPVLNPPTITQALAVIAGTSGPDATFNTSLINWGRDDPPSADETLTTWFNGNMSNLTDQGNARDGIAPITGDTVILGSIIRVSGKVDLNNGDLVGVRSDDGYVLDIGGGEFSRFEGLRAPGTTTVAYAGVGGLMDFTLTYFEAQRTQATLQFLVNGAPTTVVPLPAAGLLLLGGLAGLGFISRKRKAA